MSALRLVFVLGLVVLVIAPAIGASMLALLGLQGVSNAGWDVLNHFAPIWLCAALTGFVAAFALSLGPRLIVCVACLIGMGSAGSMMAAEYLRPTDPAAATEAGLKIVQFNTWVYNSNAERVISWLQSEDPDIAVLEEVSPALRQALAGQSAWYVSCANCEVVVLSKTPPLTAERVGTATRVTLRDEQGEYAVIGAHHAWPTDPEQARQEERLATLVDQVNRERAIVASDLNSTPWSFERRRWDDRLGLIRRDRALPTWPARDLDGLPFTGRLPILPIDHVYAGEAWATVEVRRGPNGLGSDHYPLIVTLAAR